MINTRTFSITLTVLLLAPLAAMSAAETSPPAEAGRTVIERLRKGINYEKYLCDAFAKPYEEFVGLLTKIHQRLIEQLEKEGRLAR
jgi:hypothetical protein